MSDTRMTSEKALAYFGPDWPRRMVAVWKGRWCYHYLDADAQVGHTSSNRPPDVYALKSVVDSLGFAECSRCREAE